MNDILIPALVVVILILGYKLNQFLDAKIELCRLELEEENRRWSILQAIDVLTKEQAELLENCRLYHDLGDNDQHQNCISQFHKKESEKMVLKGRLA